MKKILTILATTALLITGGTTATAGGSDDSQPLVDYGDKYIEVRWATPIKTDDPNPPTHNEPRIWDQTLATTDTCGVYLQVDRYKDIPATHAQIDTGVLTDGDDYELLNYDYPFESTGNPWKFEAAPECVDPEPDVKEGAESSQTYVCDSPANGTAIKTTTRTEWTEVDGKRTYSDPVVIIDTVTDADCDYDHTQHKATPAPEVPETVTNTPAATPAVPVEAEATFTG